MSQEERKSLKGI